MLRIPKTHIDGAVFYVTSRGDRSENIFRDEGDYRAYIELLKKYKEQYGFKLFSFVLMPDHLHLLLELKPGLSLSDIMHDLHSNYTKYFNGRYQLKGHLFQERYKMALLEKDAYLLPASAYIHLNPVSLRGANEVSDEAIPEDAIASGARRPRNDREGLGSYPYSSYMYYSPNVSSQLRLETFGQWDLRREIEEVTVRLVEKNFSGYDEYLAGLRPLELETIGRQLANGAILGSEKFVRDIEEQAQAQKPQASAKPVFPKRNFIIAGIALIIALVAANIYFYSARSERLQNRMEREELELKQKYQSQIDAYYRDMTRSLELEKQKARYLEEKVTENP